METTAVVQTLTDELLGEIEFDAECHGSGATVAHTLSMLEEICTLRAENAELRKDAAIARDHLISARHDVEYRSQYGSEAARLVLAGIDQYLGDTAMEQAK